MNCFISAFYTLWTNHSHVPITISLDGKKFSKTGDNCTDLSPAHVILRVEVASLVCYLCSCISTCNYRTPALGSMFCCAFPKVLIVFELGALPLHFAPNLTNRAPGATWELNMHTAVCWQLCVTMTFHFVLGCSMWNSQIIAGFVGMQHTLYNKSPPSIYFIRVILWHLNSIWDVPQFHTVQGLWFGCKWSKRVLFRGGDLGRGQHVSIPSRFFPPVGAEEHENAAERT